MTVEKTRVSPSHFGAMLWELCTKFTLEFTKKFPHEAADKETLTNRVVEILSLHAWIAIKAVGTENGAVLDEFHRFYLESVGKDLQPEVPLPELKRRLLARYEDYYKTWTDGGSALQSPFSSKAAEILLGTGRDFSTLDRVHFVTWVLGAMAAVLKMRSDVELAEEN